MASTPSGNGYWVTTTDKALPPSGPVPSVLSQCTQPEAAPQVGPSDIVLACGDGNASLDHLTWSSWTATGASGTGTYTHNTCIPDCADGKLVSAPANPVRLSYPIETRAGREFAAITYTYRSSAPGGSTTVVSVIPVSAG
jgi:hypothetical protein